MYTALLSAVLVINELMASNAGVVMSPATNFDSWIEIYNPGDEAVDLGGMYLSNDEYNLTRWQLPSSIGKVPANGFKVLWLGSNDILLTHAPFKLDCDGGTICLSDRQGNLIVSQDYPASMSRSSYARTTDGGEEWGWTADVTPGASNATAHFANSYLEAPNVSVGSCLFDKPFSFEVEIPEGAILMYTTDGSLPTSTKEGDGTSQTQPQKPVNEWTELLVNGDCEGNDATCFVSYNGDESKDVNRILNGVGYKGSRGIKVHSIDNPENSWDTQFFVYTPNHVWQAGEKYRFSMRVRADKPVHISAQTHATPHSYIHWDCLGGGVSFTTEWQEFSYEGVITEEQAGTGMQTIAFNLNESTEANNYYFDDLSWMLCTEDGSGLAPDIVTSNTAKRSLDGKFSVRNTTSYVFRLFEDGYLPSKPVTRSFIKRDKDFTIPVISIVGDDRYFNDPMWGIDVKGENGIPGKGRDDAVNWNQPWDRPVNFSYISPEGEMLFNQDVNISVSGGWSRKDSPRSFKLKSNKVFDGLNHLDYPFFPQKPFIRSKALVVRNGGNDSWCRFKDPALTTIVQRSGIDLDVQSTVQVAEYINGKFRGVLNLREPNNDKFVYANWGYDDEEIDAFENEYFTNGTAETYNYLVKLSERINAEGVYDKVKSLLDIDEFTNYMAAELYIGNSDWPANNVKGYRSQDDGRYRFVLFDLDQVFNYYCDMTSISTLETNKNFSKIPLVQLFRNLLGNDEYRKKFLDTFCLMGGSVFERQRATAIVNELADAMRPMQQLEGRSPDGTANEIKEKLNSRLDVAMGQLQEYEPARIKGIQKQSVQLSADTDGATLLLNGMTVPYASFNGYLFAPVTLEAKAPAGYTFAGWKKGGASLTTISDYSSQWRYYDGGEAANGWQNVGFDDSKWSVGQAPLGYAMNGIATTISYGDNDQQKHPTTYFRQNVSLSKAPAANDNFVLSYQADDGCVVYVNGQEAGRVNMRQGNVYYDTFSQTYAGSTPLEGTLDLPATLFHKGSNVVAVEVHNTNYTSSDLYWAAMLQTTISDAEEHIVSSEPVISLPDDAKLSLVAMFEPMSDEKRAAEHIVPVRINEVSAANGIYVNEYFKHNDWVELYNTTDQPIDVEGMYLSDNLKKPKKYQIAKPESQDPDLQPTTIIPAHGYLVVWCDKLVPLTQLHATFKLDADGGDVVLTAGDESWSDRFNYAAMNDDQTAGRYPDGTADIYTMNIPTIGKANITSTYVTSVKQPIVTGISNMADNNGLHVSYAGGHLVVDSSADGDVRMSVTNLSGQKVLATTSRVRGGHADMSVSQLRHGVYVAVVSDSNGNKGACKFVIK